jgi:hypothetical protein
MNSWYSRAGRTSLECAGVPGPDSAAPLQVSGQNWKQNICRILQSNLYSLKQRVPNGTLQKRLRKNYTLFCPVGAESAYPGCQGRLR